MNRLGTRFPAIVGGRDPRSWYDVEPIDDATFAIHEHHYWQRNTNHLIVGARRAVLFDSGSGLSDPAAVVGALTDKPVVVLASHLHWDHIGGHHRFAEVAAPDLPAVRALLREGAVRTRPSSTLTLRRRRLSVTEWVRPGSTLDLGGRHLTVHHTPGHTADSISLYDPERRQLFTGDLLYDGPLTFGVIPGSDLHAAHRTAERLARSCDPVTIHGGHYGALPGHRLGALPDALAAVRAASGSGRARGLRRYEVAGFVVVQGFLRPRADPS